ncbi:MAG: hypothetical protein LUF89_00330 [Ruminococcus sp.]|nr:hypothetical protein [Ruminococcus sp.]
MRWREYIYCIIEPSDECSNIRKIYDYSMIVMIIASIIPLAFKDSNCIFKGIDIVTTIVFLLIIF